MRGKRLLGARNQVIGEAWAEFLQSREPSQVLAFLADPEIIAYSTKPPFINDKASRLNFLDAIGLLVKSRNFAFEEIAQKTGIINYHAGESLSQHLQDAEARILGGQKPIPRQAETPENAEIICQNFDSDFGKVDPAHLGLPTASGITHAESNKLVPPKDHQR